MPGGTILKKPLLSSEYSQAQVRRWEAGFSVFEKLILNTQMAHGCYLACQTPVIDCGCQDPCAVDSEPESGLNGSLLLVSNVSQGHTVEKLLAQCLC